MRTVMFRRPGLRVVFLIALILYAALAAIPAPLMPQAGLDGAWVLAAEYAARTGAVFGRDFVFTYGPLSVLSTHLFRPETFGFVLLGDLLISAMWLSPLAFNASRATMIAYLVVVLAAPWGTDARIVGGLLAFIVTAVRRPGWWTIAVAIMVAPFALSKLSFFLVILPMLVILDVHRIAVARRLPLATVAFLGAFCICLLTTAQPIAFWVLAARQDLEVIGGYGSAMQLAIGSGGLLALGAIVSGWLLVILFFGWLSRSRLRGLDRWFPDWLAVALAALWASYIAFKMGNVRADAHMLITWSVLLLMLPPLAAMLDDRSRLKRRELVALVGVVVLLAAVSSGFAFKFADPRPSIGQFAEKRARDLIVPPIQALAWLTPEHWRSATRERRAADMAMTRAFPSTVVGPVDAIPIDVGTIIESGLNYRPRPVPQSYSSYTPTLQRIDAVFFANSARAPDTLFFRMGYDVDFRLPTLATGPSLPIIARWYDFVGTDELGLILRRRDTPRAVVRTPARTMRFKLGEWVAMPAATETDRLIASIRIDESLIAKGLGLLAREPTLSIELRRADGTTQSFRFIPGMARIGVTLSPMMRHPDVPMSDLAGAAGVLFPGRDAGAVSTTTAFRISGDPIALRTFSGGEAMIWAERFRPGK